MAQTLLLSGPNEGIGRRRAPGSSGTLGEVEVATSVVEAGGCRERRYARLLTPGTARVGLPCGAD
ncbi:hypothetical protein [Candidatus Poriferisodalis sp.]|uniref:hypothetical protein n=1 Tax=Candidatus Poriferisodalis sp. TaxID=3101277 RepID=UPI003B01130B